MAKEEYIEGFLESFDPNTFNKYDHAFQSSYMDNVDTYFSRIQDSQNKINNLQKVIEGGGASGTQYNSAKSIYTKILNDYQATYNSFLRNPASQLTAYPKAIAEARATLKELKKDPNPSTKTLRSIAGTEKQIASYEKSYQDQIAKKTAGYEAQLQKYRDQIQGFNDDEVEYAQKQIPELQKTVGGYAKDIAELNAMSIDSVQKRMATDLEYFMGRLDSIDKQEALKQKELTGYGAKDGIDLDYVAARDKAISDIYDSINDRVGKLTSYAANYGVKVPDEIINPETVRDFYSDVKGRVSDDNTLADILGGYTSELINPYVRDEVVAINEADPGTSFAPDVVEKVNEIFGTNNNFVAPPPSSESEEVLQMYAANPQKERVVDTRTAAERIADMGAPFVPGKIPEAPLNFGDVNWRERTSDPSYVGASGLTREQANDLAKQFLVYGNMQLVNENGRPILYQVESLSDEILNFGWQPTYNRLSEYANFKAYPTNYIDRGVAEQFAKDLMVRGGYAEDSPYITSWANTVQNVGFDEAVERYLKINPGVEGRNPAPNQQDITNYINANNTALEKLNETTRSTFNTNVQNILKGEDFSFGATNVSKDDYLDFILNGREVEDLTPEQKNILDYWDTTYQTLGPEAAIGRYNTVVKSGSPMSFAEPQAPFQPDIYGEAGTSTQPFEPDIYGGTQEPAAPTTPTTGTPTSPYPTTTTPTAPTTGLPALAFTPGQIRGYTPTTQQAPQAPTTTYQPAPYTPPELLQQAPERPVLSPSQELIGAPTIERPVGAPMAPLTAEQTGSTFVPPTQEDYYAYFGYTPEQLNAAQYLAEMEGAPRAGIGAQTVPVLPPAVPGATAPTGMKEGGMPQDAQRLANQGRNGDSMLVHMTPDEVAGLQSLAQQMGGSLTINPETGLPEANFFKRFLGPIVALGATVLTGGAVSPLTASLAFGGGYAVGSGSLEKGIMAGVGAYSGANLLAAGYTGLTGSALPGYTMPTAAAGAGAGAGAGTGTGSSAMGAGVETGSSGTALGTTATQEAMGTAALPEKTLVERATDYLQAPSTVPTTANSLVGNTLAFASSGEMSDNLDLMEQMEAKSRQDAATQAAILAREDEKNRRLFETTLGAIPVRSGGLIALAGGGMTYAEGGGTTGATNEPRMVKGTGDGMSDSVPATIEGVQEARLANDEFVVPADVVADLGNGSSSAGAQQLYDMMDRVRQARHGTTEQPPEINVRKLMPA